MCGIFVEIPQQQKGYLIYVPSTQKIFSSNYIVFEKTYSGGLVYMSCTYSEALAMELAVSYILYTTSYHAQKDNIITFAQFEGGGLAEN